MIRHFLNPPNWFTSASIFCSSYAMMMLVAAGGAPDAETLRRACILVVFGGVFDLLDGRVARVMNRYTEFGVQLDSIADIISFGVAPALLAYAWKLQYLGVIGAGAAFFYVLCASYRLARFNVSTIRRDWSLEGHSQGLTTTMAGGTLVTLVWVSNGVLSEVLRLTGPTIAIVTAGFGLLMVSSVPFRNFRDMKVNRKARVFFALALALCLAGAVVYDVSMLFGVGGALYVTAGLLDGLVVMVHRRLAGEKLPGDDEEAELDALDGELVPIEDDA